MASICKAFFPSLSTFETPPQLSYTTLCAPVAGVIARKHVTVGWVVQAGRPVLAVVPLDHLWVEANFQETPLRPMRPGHKATLHVDASPGQVFRGTVDRLSPGTGSVFRLLPPENATGNFVKVVQRIPVRLRFKPNQEGLDRLRAGMSVEPEVRIGK